jgi:amino acid transporter
MNDSLADSPPIPKPAWWQAALTRLVVTVFVLLLTIACFLFLLVILDVAEPRGRGERPWFFAVVGIVILTQFLLVIFLPVRWQYRGTFCGDSASAFKASLVWYAVAALLLVLTVVSLHLPAIVKAGPLAALLAALGFASQRRREQLERHYAEHPELRPQKETDRKSGLWI